MYVIIWSIEATELESATGHAKRWSLDWKLPITDHKCFSMSFGNVLLS